MDFNLPKLSHLSVLSHGILEVGKLTQHQKQQIVEECQNTLDLYAFSS